MQESTVYMQKQYDPRGIAAPTWMVYREGLPGQKIIIAVWTTELKALKHVAELTEKRGW